MNKPLDGGLAALNVPAYVKHRGLIDWVASFVALAASTVRLVMK